MLGDWRGQEQSRAVAYQDQVELILDGAPDAQSGTYHLLVTTPGLDTGAPAHWLNWADTWTRGSIASGGRIFTWFHLAHVPDARTTDYLLTPNGALVPVVDPHKPDLSPDAMRLALLPLARTEYGYGRP